MAPMPGQADGKAAHAEAGRRHDEAGRHPGSGHPQQPARSIPPETQAVLGAQVEPSNQLEIRIYNGIIRWLGQ
eukprot:4071663-Heterocapsa_arctica.AAC.1